MDGVEDDEDYYYMNQTEHTQRKRDMLSLSIDYYYDYYKSEEAIRVISYTLLIGDHPLIYDDPPGP